MGQKVNPIGIRLGFTKKSNAIWYPDGDTFANTLKNDINIRTYIKKYLAKKSNIGTIIIERIGSSVKITINAAKPGAIIGKKGEDIEKLKINLTKNYNITVNINVEEIKNPDIDATLLAENIAMQIKKRIKCKKIMKKIALNAIKQGAKGIKISVSGRMGGIDIAKKEWHKDGHIPLNTFKADIDYAFTPVKTVYGIIGVKVWIYKGNININNNIETKKVEENVTT